MRRPGRRIGVWRLPPEFSGARVAAFESPSGAIVWRWCHPPDVLDVALFHAVRDELEQEARERAGRQAPVRLARRPRLEASA